MPWIEQPDGSLLHEETGVIYNDDNPVFFNIYEHEGKAVLFITNEEIPNDVDPREFVGSINTNSSYFDGDIMRNTVWRDHFRRSQAHTPKAMFKLLCNEFYRIENNYSNPTPLQQIEDLVDGFKHVIPGGSMLAGIGGQQHISTSNCFVIPGPEDSYGGILKTDQEQIQLMKRRGGVGFDLGKIRPAGSVVSNAAKTSTGLVPFMERFSNSTQEVSQDGKRGALMLTLPLNHDNVDKFIDAKLDKNKINYANISVKVSDHSMLKYVQHIRPPKNSSSYSASRPKFNIPSDDLSTGSMKDDCFMLDKIANNQCVSAEPGLLYWDRIIRESPADCYSAQGFETISTNPCGEMPLSAYDSCRLLHMNLPSYVVDPFTSNAEFDFDALAKDVIIAQRLLDDAVDLEIENIDRIIAKIISDPESESIKRTELELWQNVKTVAINGRRTGLGHTGLADVFASLGIPYGSDESIRLAVNIQKEIAINSYKSSIILASERGAFPIFNHCNENNHIFLERIFELLDDDNDVMSLYSKYGRRNIANLTIAPTGTVSILAGCSSGIEPVFDVFYQRKVRASKTINEWTTYNVIHPWFKLWYNINIFPTTKIPIDGMTKEQVNETLLMSPYCGSLANDVNPMQKIKLIGSVQKYVDNAISVTHNLPQGTDVHVIKEMIVESFLQGCKGFTVYVDGSRDNILSHTDGTDKLTTFSKTDAIKRPDSLIAEIHTVTINKINYCVALGLLDGSPYEVFAFEIPDTSVLKMLKDTTNKFTIVKIKSKQYDLCIYHSDDHIYTISGFNKNMSNDAEVICRILSTALRHGVDITFLYEQIQSSNTDINSFAKAISRTFKKYIQQDKLNRKLIECPNCHSNTLRFQEGCLTCSSCGYSRC